jgi:hypothetical protein
MSLQCQTRTGETDTYTLDIKIAQVGHVYLGSASVYLSHPSIRYLHNTYILQCGIPLRLSATGACPMVPAFYRLASY